MGLWTKRDMRGKEGGGGGGGGSLKLWSHGINAQSMTKEQIYHLKKENSTYQTNYYYSNPHIKTNYRHKKFIP